MTKDTLTTVNDNEDAISDDEATLKEFISFIEDRGIEVNTAFVLDEDEGVYTHQIMRISCGEYATVSQPEALSTPLLPAGAPEGSTLN